MAVAERKVRESPGKGSERGFCVGAARRLLEGRKKMHAGIVDETREALGRPMNPGLQQEEYGWLRASERSLSLIEKALKIINQKGGCEEVMPLLEELGIAREMRLGDVQPAKIQSAGSSQYCG